PMIILLAFEVCSSWLSSVFPCLKSLLSTSPATLIINGKINQKEMRNARLSIDELLSELRQSGVSDISEVRYAILEQNGKLTIIPKADYKPLTPRDMNISVCDNGMEHIVISEGFINKYALKVLNINEKEVNEILSSRRLQKKQVYLMLIDDSGNVKIFKKENK
ncbi:MAG: DUF421 domain-containing protein, partial [Clostridia bacterium]|nr:DUF421 domain-containing protein [Clostridia bacterium]